MVIFVDKNNYLIYIHKNKINGKQYVGMTCQSVEQRWRNGKNYKSCTAFNRAIEKYGWESFEHIILYDCLSKDDACKLESETIRRLQTQNPDYGYNICDGGVGTSGYVPDDKERKRRSEMWLGEKNPNYNGKLVTQEWKEKMRQINLGSKHSEAHKKKIGDSLRGRHYHDDEFRKRLSERNSHAVEREDGIVFSTVTEAANSIGVSYASISNAIKRGNRSGGYRWKYVEIKA